MNSMRGSDDQKLDALFQAYREACEAPETSANFMPNLWARIESRQTFAFSFRRMAQALTTAAVALSIALGVYMAIPRPTALDGQTYVEALADYNSAADALDPNAPAVLALSEHR
jgi:hypothetical protein